MYHPELPHDPDRVPEELNALREALAEQGILPDTKRSNHKRFLSLCLAGSDTGDGNDGAGKVSDVSSQPSSPSLPSQIS